MLDEHEVDLVLSEVAVPEAGDVEVVYLPKAWQDEGELELLLAQAMKMCVLRRERDRLLALTQAQNAELLALNTSLEKKVAQRTARALENRDLLGGSQSRRRSRVRRDSASIRESDSGRHARHRERAQDRGAKRRSTAKVLGLNELQQRHVHLAGLLCDLGKLVLSEALIKTPLSR